MNQAKKKLVFLISIDIFLSLLSFISIPYYYWQMYHFEFMTEIEKIVLGLLFLVMLFLSVILLPIDIQDFRKSTEYKDSKFRIKGLKILTSRTYGNSIVMVFFSIVGIALLAYNYHIKFGYHYDDMALLGVAFVGILVCSIWKTVVDIRNYWKKKKEINPSKKCELL